MAWLTLNRIEMYATRRRLDEERPATRVPRNLGPPKALLAWSRFDRPILPGVVELFEDLGAGVLADEGDARLEALKANPLEGWHRQQLEAMHRFIITVTPNSKNMRWMPWLLGWMSGHRGSLERLALLPISEKGGEEPWLDEAYFGLCPRILEVDHELRVVDPIDGRYWPLMEWIEGRPKIDLFG